MQVTINGSPREVPDNVTVRELMVHLGLADGPVAVEINREIIARAEHATHKVAGGDMVEVVHLVGGG